MLQFLTGFGDYSSANVQVFRGNATDTTTVNYWSMWRKPPGKGLLFALGTGGGGSGGGGRGGAAATARGGGGAGGGASTTTVVIPLIFLPDRLYIRVGLGAQGVAAATPGNLGGRTFISVTGSAASVAGNNLLLRADEGNGGSAGSTSGSAGGGSGGSATATTGACVIAAMGSIQTVAGITGGNGGAATGTAGANAAIQNSLTSGGGGGGGTTSGDFAGGGIAGSGAAWLNELFQAVAAAGSNPGSGGHNLFPPAYPLQAFGGYGGGASNAGVGGDGGPGGIGSGGGGGGGGTTGGRGGPGGDGIVIMVCV